MCVDIVYMFIVQTSIETIPTKRMIESILFSFVVYWKDDIVSAPTYVLQQRGTKSPLFYSFTQGYDRATICTYSLLFNTKVILIMRLDQKKYLSE